MKPVFILGTLCMLAACRQQKHRPPQPEEIILSYRQKEIQKTFDTLYNNLQSAPGLYTGFMEQALALCEHDASYKDSITQDVLSSMYLNHYNNKYDCVTTTTFRFHDGTITAMGVFNLTPGDTIAPDHDFPITGGSAAYRNIYGTYTRQYRNGVYHVALKYYKRH